MTEQTVGEIELPCQECAAKDRIIADMHTQLRDAEAEIRSLRAELRETR